MNKHTPGEWVVSKTYLDGSSSTVITRVSAPDKGTTICDIWGMNTEEGKANAKLIAAAPELLGALQELVKTFNPYNQAMYRFAFEQIKQAEQAIKKATE